MTSINVPLGEQSYDVLVKAGALKRVGMKSVCDGGLMTGYA